MTRAKLLIVVPLAALLGCGQIDIHQYPCPDGGTALTYASFGEEFLTRNCQSCHAGVSTNRQGAPVEIAFDTEAEVMGKRERVYARAAGDFPSMPPGPDKPPAEDRARLAEWLACGNVGRSVE